MLQFAITLQVVLTSCEVPHEIAPVHEVALIGKEESDVLQHCGNFHVDHLAATVVWHQCALNTAHPTLVGCGMGRAVHTWEKHILCILILILGAHHKVGVLLVG